MAQPLPLPTLRPTVSVVLPCLNEADSVALCVREALESMAGADYTGEVIVVDNGSTDGSAELAAQAGARVVRESRRGYGSALRAGIEAARGEIVVMADADWTYDFRKLPLLVEPIAEGDADLVLGSRLSAATRRSMPLLHRYVGTPVLTFLVSRATGGIAVTDSQSGFRAFRRSDAMLLGLRADGMEFASEMLIRAGQHGLRVLDVPTGYRERIGDSKLNTFADGRRHLFLIARMVPQIFLVGLGLGLFLAGLAVTLMGLVSPSGVDVGSLRWQPVFFSSIAIVLGLQSGTVGVVLAHQAAIRHRAPTVPFRFVRHAAFPSRCMRAGLVSLLGGFALDGGLFWRWLSHTGTPSQEVALAALAQTLIIAGASLAALGALIRAARAAEREADLRVGIAAASSDQERGAGRPAILALSSAGSDPCSD